MPRDRTKSLMTVERLRKCAADGLTRAEAARRIGVSKSYVHALAKVFGIGFRRLRGHPLAPIPRHLDWQARHLAGATFAQIARESGVSKQAVHYAVSRLRAQAMEAS